MPVGVMRFDYLARISLNNLRPLLSLFSADLAIDLGTVNTRVYAQGRGIVVNEPSAVALDDRTDEVQAVGKEAKEMLGRTPAHIRVVRPLKNGVIADFKVTEKMLSYFIQKAQQRRTLVHPRIVVGIEPARASCRWRVTALALSVAMRVHNSTMAAFRGAPR